MGEDRNCSGGDSNRLSTPPLSRVNLRQHRGAGRCADFTCRRPAGVPPIGFSIAAKSMMNLCQTPETVIPLSSTKAMEPKRTARGRGFIAWLAPDLALTFALITLLSVFFVFDGATALFEDSDTGWHIRTGERIVSTRSLPHADPFSFSKAGEPWVAWEWGADVLMGAVFRVSGLAGVALLFGLSIAASVWMWFRLNRAAGGNCLFACLFFIPMLPATTLHWLARPHIFSWLFLLGTVWFCERMPRRLGWRHLTLAAIAAAAWANIHASFFFAPLIVLVYAAGAYLRPLIWDVRGPLIRKARTTSVRSYLWLALAALLGTLVNPSGWRLHQHVLSYLFDSGLLDHITEFQSFNFHEEGALKVMLMLAICFAGAFAALAVSKPGRFLLSMLLTAVALRSVRALPVAALLLMPLANGSITMVLRRARNLAPRLRKGLDGVLNYGDGLHGIERRFLGFAIVPLVAILILAAIRTRAGFPANELPVAASALVAALPVGARILVPDTFGGYLIYRFNGERKVFFDGRSDFYGDDFIRRYSRLLGAAPGWRNEFNRWNFTHALLPPDYPFIPVLEANGWHEIYRDRTAVLLTGRSRL